MEIRYFRFGSAFKGDPGLRSLYVGFNSRHAFNRLTLTLPTLNYDSDWYLLPVITSAREKSVVPGLSFHVALKWLRFTILKFQWYRTPKDVEETADQY